MAIRNEYDQLGPKAFYEKHGHAYRNPHEKLIRTALRELAATGGLDLSNVLDLAAGSGEVTLAVRELGGKAAGVDPYTHAAYLERTGQVCEQMTFEQTAAGALAGRNYSLVVCSFAMHLVEVSRLPLLAGALAEVSPALLILTPHKRPILEPGWGWWLEEERTYTTGEPDHLRCRARLYGRRV